VERSGLQCFKYALRADLPHRTEGKRFEISHWFAPRANTANVVAVGLRYLERCAAIGCGVAIRVTVFGDSSIALALDPDFVMPRARITSPNTANQHGVVRLVGVLTLFALLAPRSLQIVAIIKQ
jgi:hypothetical protein